MSSDIKSKDVTQIDAGALQPWEKRADETPQQYAAFLCYLLMDQPRSLERACHLAREQGIVRARQARGIKEWSRTYDWVFRVRAWDATQAEALRIRLEKERQDELIAANRRHVNISRTLQEVGVRRLSELLKDQSAISALGVSELLRYLLEGIRTERLALGLDTSRTTVQGGVAIGGRVEHAHQHQHRAELDLTQMPDEQLDLLDRLAEQVAAKRKK